MQVCVIAALVLVMASSLLAPSCGNHAERQPVGYPCARDRDCEGHLLCVGGTCRVEPSDGPAGD
jgi:hypothetical protein